MANYVFEEMSDSDAAAFTSTDNLFFETATVSTLNVRDNAATSNAFGSTSETITLTSGSVSHTFLATALSDASHDNDIVFIHGSNSDALAIVNGDQTAGGYSQLASVTAGGHVQIDGIGSAGDTLQGTVADDTITGSAGNDVINGVSDNSTTGSHNDNDYLQGGAGADTITGGNGNDHIYGNLLSATQGSTDGNDMISAGNGNDYVNGNAGNDTIDGGLGNDRLEGGGGNDHITGGEGNDNINGNLGNDVIDGGNGTDLVQGGQGDDSVGGGNGNDIVNGNIGNDTLHGDAGYDVLTGGTGNDVFQYAAGAHDADILNITSASTAANHDLTESITDFTHGSDSISLGFTGVAANVLYQAAGVTFASNGLDAAYTYAQQLINQDFAANGTHVHDVAAITVGSDTYLFYNDTAAGGETINEVIKLDGITASSTTISSSDIHG